MKFLKKKLVFILSLVFIISIGTFGYSYGYFNSVKSITNCFKAGTVTYDFTECFTSPDNWNPADCTPKIINICNTGTKAVYCRVKFTPSWDCNLPVCNVTYEPHNPLWIKVGDYFYYKKILGSTMEKTSNIKNVSLPLVVVFGANSGNEYQGMTYRLKVDTEVLQAKNNAVMTAWNLTAAQMALIGFEPY